MLNPLRSEDEAFRLLLGVIAVFAVIIAMIGSYQGLTTRGGAAGVGKATTGAVVTSIILIFIFNFALSYVLYGSQ